MSGDSQQSALTGTGAGDQTGLGSHANIDGRKYKLSRHPRIRQLLANKNLLRQRAWMYAARRAGSADGNAATTEGSGSSSDTAGSRPRNRFTNLESFVRCVSPIVPVQLLCEANASKEAKETCPCYFRLEDLWETFEECSGYGNGVPFLLNGTHPSTQYYVPYLSGMQLFIDPKKPPTTTGGLAEEKDVKSNEPNQQTDLVSDGSFASLNLNNQKLKQVAMSDNETDVCGSRDKLVFQYIEQEGPYTRKPLATQVATLESRFPELSNYMSCDLLPSSWICVAWYPIYRIPVGPTQEEVEACFLTLHSLSTQPEGYSQRVDGRNDPFPRVSLPALGMFSYKLNGSMISPRDPDERDKEHDLWMTAYHWLSKVETYFPDYQFFVNRYSSG